jgi:hypothetical protein
VRLLLASYCTGIMLGTYLLQPARTLLICVSLLAISLLLLWAGRRYCKLWYPAGLILAALVGLSWHACWAMQRMAQQLPAELAGLELEVVGYISSLPQQRLRSQQFQFRVSHSKQGLAGRLLQLNYYGAETLGAGQRWHFRVRLRQPRGLANPIPFDYAATLLQQGVAARGYVREDIDNRLLGRRWLSLSGWRGELKQRLLAIASKLDHGDIILAPFRYLWPAYSPGCVHLFLASRTANALAAVTDADLATPTILRRGRNARSYPVQPVSWLHFADATSLGHGAGLCHCAIATPT